MRYKGNFIITFFYNTSIAKVMRITKNFTCHMRVVQIYFTFNQSMNIIKKIVVVIVSYSISLVSKVSNSS